MRIPELTRFLKGNDRSSRAKRQVLYSFGFKGLSVLTGLLYVPLLLDILDKEGYGIWVTFLSIFSWFIVFDGGLGNGLRNRLTSALAANDLVLGRKYISTAYTLVFCLSTVLSISFLAVNSHLNWNKILNTSSVPKNDLFILSSIVFLFFMGRFVLQILGFVFLADQKPALGNGLGTIGNFVSLLVILIVHKMADRLSLLNLGMIISAVPVAVLLTASVIAFSGPYKQLRPSFAYIDLTLTRSLIGLGFQFFLMQLGGLVQYASANIAISRLFGPSEVTIFNIAFQYFQVPIVLFSVIVSPIWSAVTDAHTLGDYEWLNRTLAKLKEVALLFTVGILFMIMLSPIIYRIWIGHRVAIPFTLSMCIGFYAIISVWLAPYSSFINGLGRLRLTSTLAIPLIGIYILLVILFSDFLGGSVGVISAMSVISLISLILQPIQTHKLLQRTANGIWAK